MTMLTVALPFAGFYGSHHDADLSYALEAMFTNDHGDFCPGLTDRVSGACDWSAVHRAFARAFAETYCEEVGIDGARFESRDSPTFYNFETDRVFIELPPEEARRMLRTTSPAALDQVARDRHTSRSGFISFYSPDWRTWGEVEGWDHNQLQTLIEAYVRETRSELDETGLMESARCNGRIEGLVESNTPGLSGSIAFTTTCADERNGRDHCTPIPGGYSAMHKLPVPSWNFATCGSQPETREVDPKKSHPHITQVKSEIIGFAFGRSASQRP
ncbi:hypothetical protein ACVWWQ_003055 [Rhodanobacter sp. TND4EL1]